MRGINPSNFIGIGDLREKVRWKRPDIDMDGDCATWAILSAIHKAGKDLGYLELAEEIVQLKQNRYSIYSSRFHYDESWFNRHGSLRTELINEILDNHLDLSFTEMRSIGFVPLRKVAQSFEPISIALARTPQHITFITEGKVYDTWDSTERHVLSVLVPSRDMEMALSIFQELDRDNRIGLREPRRDLSDSEESIARKIQDKINISGTYRKTLWVLAQVHGQISFVRLIELIKEAVFRDSRFTWKGDRSNELVRKIIGHLDTQGVINMLDPNAPDSLIFRTESTIAILRNLRFD